MAAGSRAAHWNNVPRPHLLCKDHPSPELDTYTAWVPPNVPPKQQGGGREAVCVCADVPSHSCCAGTTQVITLVLVDTYTAWSGMQG